MLSKCVESAHVIDFFVPGPKLLGGIVTRLSKIAYCMTCEAYYDITDGQLLSKKEVIKTE